MGGFQDECEMCPMQWLYEIVHLACQAHHDRSYKKSLLDQIVKSTGN